jgi:SAM-dependent methyltransferase
MLAAPMRVDADLLRCPVDGRPLAVDGATLVCEIVPAHRYPVVDGVPVLIDDSASLFTIDEVAASGASPAARGLLERIAYRIYPTPPTNHGASERFERFRDLVCASSDAPSARVLVVGGGELGEGMQSIDGDPRIELIDTDVYISKRVAVACDAHQLPFADGVFDGAIVQAVLEHVVSPHQVVAEIHRVLKPGGVVYAETPFLQAVHEGAYDFTRFTELGHRRLFRWFEEIDRGVAVGPATALLWSLRYFARSLPRRGGFAVRALDFAVTCSAFWLVHLDRRLVGHAGAADAASGVYFLGRRAEQPVGDREIVASYSGTAAGKSAEDRSFPT